MARALVDTQWVTRLISGPSTFAAWEASWKVFRTAMIMLGVASPDDLDAYADGIKDLYITCPELWGMIVEADEAMCGEQWDALRFELRLEPPVDFNHAAPWSFIIEKSAFLVEGGIRARWWQRRLVLPITSPEGHPEETAARLEGAATGSGSGREAHASGLVSTFPPLPARKQPSQEAGMKQASAQAERACPDYNANKKPCKKAGSCPKGLKHVCSVCGGPHPLHRSRRCSKQA